MTNAIKKFPHLESASGLILILAALLALLLANSPLAHHYQAFLDIDVQIRIGALDLHKPLLLWINEGLMAIFFLLIGLEVKREMIHGELNTNAKRFLPGIGAFFGLICPAIVYTIVNFSYPEYLSGWAIPTATDIAFAVGVLALLATQLKTVSGVREAEQQTIVAQAAQNLIEGMLINPTLSPATASGVESGWTLKSYPDYVTSSSKKIEKDEGEIKYVNEVAISKRGLANKQKAQFSNELWHGLGGIPVHFIICRDTSGKAPVIKGGKMEANCTSGNNAPTYIKVAWLVEKEGGDALTAVNADGDYIVYTYQAQVTE